MVDRLRVLGAAGRPLLQPPVSWFVLGLKWPAGRLILSPLLAPSAWPREEVFVERCDLDGRTRVDRWLLALPFSPHVFRSVLPPVSGGTEGLAGVVCAPSPCRHTYHAVGRPPHGPPGHREDGGTSGCRGPSRQKATAVSSVPCHRRRAFLNSSGSGPLGSGAASPAGPTEGRAVPRLAIDVRGVPARPVAT